MGINPFILPALYKLQLYQIFFFSRLFPVLKGFDNDAQLR